MLQQFHSDFEPQFEDIERCFGHDLEAAMYSRESRRDSRQRGNITACQIWHFHLRTRSIRSMIRVSALLRHQFVTKKATVPHTYLEYYGFCSTKAMEYGVLQGYGL